VKTSADEGAQVAAGLREMDRRCVELGVPVLSALATLDDGAPSPVLLESISRYRLALPGEMIGQTVERLREAVYEAMAGGRYDALEASLVDRC
jgi:hypothetical protein